MNGNVPIARMESQDFQQNMNLDYCAIWSYNRLRFFQPQIPEEGLYKLGEYYYIHCPKLNPLSVARDGTSLVKWFHDNRYMITPIDLVASVPPGAIRMREVTRVETSGCVGMSHTVRDIYVDLSVELPEEFPHFAIKDGAGSITILVERSLTSEETIRLNETLQRLKLAAPYMITVDTTLALAKADNFSRIPNFGDIELMPARVAKARGFSKALCDLIRNDEEYWIENRGQLDKPADFNYSDGSKCLINSSAFSTEDIRNYISLYEQVTFVAPLADYTDQFYTTAKISEAELVTLAQMGRIKLLFPQAVDRYSPKLVQSLAESAPASMMLSRKLAVATIRDCRNRIPLLYPDLSMGERADLLRGLLKAALATKDSKQRAMLEAFVVELGRIWNTAEELLHRRGAMANAVLGIASPLSEYFTAAGLPSRNIEFDFAAMTVEWAAALGASVYPVQSKGFSERPYTEILASLYSGSKNGDFPRCEAPSNVHIDLLAVGHEVPVIDFAKSFKGNEIARFRACVKSISKHQYNPDTTKDVVTAFNKEVERYAGDVARVERWDLSGLVLLAAGLVPPLAVPASIMSVGAYIHAVMKRLVDDGRVSNPLVVAWMDGVTAKLMHTTTDAVLVCRLKKRLKK